MPNSSDPVSMEVITAGMIAVGLLTFAIACALAWTKGSWRKTTALVYAGQGQVPEQKVGPMHGQKEGPMDRQVSLRWHNTRYELCEVQLSPREADSIGATSEVTIFYQLQGPENWSLQSPYRRTRLLGAGGALLAIVGTAASLADVFGLLA